MSLTARISDAKTATSLRISDAFRNERGAFDLPSIMIGVAVVAILTVGVLAAIFGVIPWAQDNGAKQDAGAVVTAQGVYHAQHGSLSSGSRYATLDGLIAQDLLPASTKVAAPGKQMIAIKVGTGTSSASSFDVVVKSNTGNYFKASSDNPTPVPATAAEFSTAGGTP